MSNPFSSLSISDASYAFVLECEKKLAPYFAQINEVEETNQSRVLAAFGSEGVAARHFAQTNGYGYDDIGRDTLDRVFARALCAEDAIVRPNFVSGTHAIFTALAGLMKAGDTMLAASGKPYDTLERAIGIVGDEYGSLKNLGVNYKQIELDKNGKIDVEAVINSMNDSVKVVYVQRSRGYAWRDSILPQEMERLFMEVHKNYPDAITVVDNCYGEFTTPAEPTVFGADVIIGSLIKNPGGGIAPTGGYIAGKKQFIEQIANRLTVPGMGREVGSYAASYEPFFHGLFMAPHTTAQALKSAMLFGCVFETIGMETMPRLGAVRSDIVQSVKMGGPVPLVALCQAIQRVSPIDSNVVPEPWDMPGYNTQVIMAAGAFVQGSSIELSADAPICEPYIVYIQGALTYVHGKIGVMAALDEMVRKKEIRL